jgi:hypothetical protein
MAYDKANQWTERARADEPHIMHMRTRVLLFAKASFLPLEWLEGTCSQSEFGGKSQGRQSFICLACEEVLQAANRLKAFYILTGSGTLSYNAT